jgi:hypothetical protein
MIKYLPIFLLLTSSLHSATLSLKDGTVIKGHIYENGNCLGNPNSQGVFLVVNKKIYLHHYPLKTKEKNVNLPNRVYTVTEEIAPTPAPPLSLDYEGINPHFVPQCVPARINFIQFSKPSLVKMHNHFSERAAFFEKRYPLTRSGNDLFYKKYNKTIASSIYKAYYATNYKKNNPKLNKEWSEKIDKYASSEFFTVGSKIK